MQQRIYVVFAASYFDLGPSLHLTNSRFNPYLGAGIGLAHNRIDSILVQYPNLDPSATEQATTTIPGGSHTNFAYMLSAGASYQWQPKLGFDLRYRYSDLG